VERHEWRLLEERRLQLCEACADGVVRGVLLLEPILGLKLSEPEGEHVLYPILFLQSSISMQTVRPHPIPIDGKRMKPHMRNLEGFFAFASFGQCHFAYPTADRRVFQ